MPEIPRGFEKEFWTEIKEREALFWSRVNKTKTCWEWTGLLSQGYGIFIIKCLNIRAHRISKSLSINRPISRFKFVDHLCRNPKCVNPDHLDLVDHRTNVLRGESPPAINARKRFCKRGHPFNKENTYIKPTGYRNCRICNRDFSTRGLSRKKQPAVEKEEK